MKLLFAYWKDFHRDPLLHSKLLWWGILLLALFIFNYTLDFEDSVIDSYRGNPIRVLWFFLFNGIAYFIALGIIHFHTKFIHKLPIKAWVLIFIALLVLSIDRSLYSHLIWLRGFVPPETYSFYLRSIFNAQSLITVCLILFIVWKIDKPAERFGLYGLRTKDVNFKLYFYLFLAMIPIIFLACFLPDIQEYYPTYKRAMGDRWSAYYGLEEYIAVIIFECAYIVDFLSVELLFRGFLVIGLSRYLGKDAIIPMVTIYAMLHFGKPIGEAISSIFGGYILGILAYYSRNIWGGVVLHAGIAVLMEVFAYLI